MMSVTRAGEIADDPGKAPYADVVEAEFILGEAHERVEHEMLYGEEPEELAT